MKYDTKDIPKFKQEVCTKTCVLNGKCIEDGKDEHWYLMCPHFFNWKIEFHSFVADNIKDLIEHPIEVKPKEKKTTTTKKKTKTVPVKKTKTTKKK